MYTVVRFYAGNDCCETLESLGARLNTLRSGLFQGLDHVSSRFSCDIAKGGDWRIHRQAISSFIKDFESEFKRARTNGFDIEFDTAIAPEDCGDASFMCVHVDLELLRQLAECGIIMEFTLYCMGPKWSRIAQEVNDNEGNDMGSPKRPT